MSLKNKYYKEFFKSIFSRAPSRSSQAHTYCTFHLYTFAHAIFNPSKKFLSSQSQTLPMCQSPGEMAVVPVYLPLKFSVQHKPSPF